MEGNFAKFKVIMLGTPNSKKREYMVALNVGCAKLSLTSPHSNHFREELICSS